MRERGNCDVSLDMKTDFLPSLKPDEGIAKDRISDKIKTEEKVENEKSNSSTMSKKKVSIISEEISELEPTFSTNEIITISSSQGVNTNEKYTTLSGTIRRGKKAGELVEVRVNVGREELERLGGIETERKAFFRRFVVSCCSVGSGLHILIFSIICVPLVFIAAAGKSFYLGTTTWYNVLTYLSEEKPLIWRVAAAPMLLSAYPFLILAGSSGLGLYAAAAQISINARSWIAKVVDLEKGFYGWLCGFLHLEDCAPYTEIIIIAQMP